MIVTNSISVQPRKKINTVLIFQYTMKTLVIIYTRPVRLNMVLKFQKIKSAYRVTLQKIACEENGFDENTAVEIKYEKNKITITKNATY